MARRILSADSALAPQAQASLERAVRTEHADAALAQADERWRTLDRHTGLFDWEDRTALMDEIGFVNRAQACLDEAAVKIAPSVLRIVLTVQRNLPDEAAQRDFLGRHLELDARRVSELCIVARSYMLADPDPARREQGAAEIARYGWSKALKLAHVTDPADRATIWDNACHGASTASYRAVLEEIRRFRERKQLGAPSTAEELPFRLDATYRSLGGLTQCLRNLYNSGDYRTALEEITHVQRELTRLRRTLRDHLSDAEIEEMAADA